MKKVYSSVLIFVVAGLAIYLLFFRGCGGIVEVFGTALLAACATVYLTVYYIYSAILYFTNRQSINLRPLLSAVVLSTIIAICLFGQSSASKEKKLLRASNSEIIDINLLEYNRIEIYYGNIEEKCSCKGFYSRIGDTILVHQIKKPKLFVVYDKYLITKTYLIPVSDNKLLEDSSLYLMRRD